MRVALRQPWRYAPCCAVVTVRATTEQAAPSLYSRRMPTDLAPMLYFAVLALLTVWATFWVIRLAVRYGMNDALNMNRDWLASQRDHDPSAR